MSITFDDIVTLAINNRKFRYWTEIRFTRAIDNIDTIEVRAPFDPEDAYHRSTFKPISYQSLSVDINGEPVFTGTMVQCSPEMATDSNTVTLAGYSLPGVLGDCPPPASTLPSEYKGQNLRDIAAVCAEPFDIKTLHRVDPGPVFKEATREPGDPVLPFLVELAKERGQLITSTMEGALLFWEAIEGGPAVARLEQRRSPLLSVRPTFNPSQYYSEITGLRPMKVRAKKSVQFTARNTLLPDVLRPHIFTVDQGQDGDVQTAVKAKAGRMFANMVSYEIEVATWRDQRGNLWEPNTILKLYAPGAMIYRETDFLIRQVVFRRGPSSETAALNLILPGSFTEDNPGRFPWED